MEQPSWTNHENGNITRLRPVSDEITPVKGWHLWALLRVAAQHNLCEQEMRVLMSKVGICGDVVEFRFNV